MLIIGAEKLSKIVDWTDKATCILFGDGAGAAVVSGHKSNEIIDVHTAADSNYANLLITPGGDERFIKMSGNEARLFALPRSRAAVGPGARPPSRSAPRAPSPAARSGSGLDRAAGDDMNNFFLFFLC